MWDNARCKPTEGRNHAQKFVAQDAREKMEDWCMYYNEERPHGAIGNKVPILLQNDDRVISPLS